jgi:hypothetical protein
MICKFLHFVYNGMYLISIVPSNKYNFAIEALSLVTNGTPVSRHP